MRILSRYVQLQFLTFLFLCFIGFLGVLVVVDLAGRLSGFIDRGVDVGTIAMYYIWSLPYFSVMILPMVMLLASLFCFGGLARFGELAAMKSAGISLYRIVAPVLVAALVVCVVMCLFTDQVMPGANRRRALIEQGEHPSLNRPVLSQVILRDVQGQILSAGTYFRLEKRATKTTLDQYRNRRLIRKIRAEQMVWEEDGWMFYNGEVRNFEADGSEVVGKFETLRGKDITLRPEDLAREVRSTDEMDLAELKIFIQRKKRNGEVATRAEVARHLRMSFPFAGAVMVLFGIPISSRTRRAGKPLLIGVCLLISFVYYGGIQAGRVMGWNGILPPFWGAWSANILFLFIGSLMLARTHK